MDTLQRVLRQFGELYGGMAPSQRLTLIVAPLLVIAGFGWLMFQRDGDSYTALSWGKVYSTEELIAAEQAFLQDGLHDFRREGQRLMVPAKDVDKYNAALVKNDAMPADLGGQLLKQYESMGPFSTEKERQERKEAMLLQEVRRVIRAVPEIQDARVAIAASGKKSWSQKARVTANVTVTARGNRELPVRLIHSIQAAVASMVPDLKPSDVTVFDVVHGVTHKGESADDPLNGQLVSRIREFQRTYEDQIYRTLSYIPDVGVTVNVDVENIKSSLVRSQLVDPKKTAPVFTQEMKLKDTLQQQPARGVAGSTANRPGSVSADVGTERSRLSTDESTQSILGVSFETSEKELIAAMPKAVQVSVAVPTDYYRSVAAQRKAAGETDPARLDVPGIEKDVLAKVGKAVKTLIPADSPPTAVTVTSVDRVTREVTAPVTPLLERAWDLLREWGGTVALVAFAAVALRMVTRSMPALPAAPVAELSPTPLTRSGGESAAEEPVREVTKRDQLQGLVRDNPEATAAIISKWLQAAK